MNKDTIRPIPNRGVFTAFVHDHGIDCLIRSADWYSLTPIERYLYNMAASYIRLEDARTETRSYSFQQYDHLRTLILLSADDPWKAAFEAYMTWETPDRTFGVVHLDQADGKRGDLILGDDPQDYSYWCPDDVVMATFDPASHSDKTPDADGA